jgi:hypothetical protein
VICGTTVGLHTTPFSALIAVLDHREKAERALAAQPLPLPPVGRPYKDVPRPSA